MRGHGRTLSSFPIATALLAGAALLGSGGHASASTSRAGNVAQDGMGDDDVALAIPRMSPFGDDKGVAWPRPLPLSEAARIRRAMALQRHGGMAEAAREADQIDTGNPLGEAMLGTVLAQRYLGPYTHPDLATLRAWLARWPTLPDAGAIHALLLTRLPRGVAPPPPPPLAALPGGHPGTMPMSPPVPEETSPAEQNVARNADLDRSIADAARHHGAPGVRRLLARTSGLNGAYASLLLGEAARVLFTINQDQAAYDLAAEGLHACERWPGKACVPAAAAGYAGGLAAWRMDEIDRARAMFEAAWHSSLTTPSLRAGAAFWAARCAERQGRPFQRLAWLRRAAAERDTFHGLIARRALGSADQTSPQDPPREALAQADVDAIAATEDGLRAFAYLQVDQPAHAEAALRRLWVGIADRPDMIRAVMLVADRAGLSGLAAQLADILQSIDGRPRDETRFRVPRLHPEGGFKMDPAMVFAVARTESDFDTETVSAAGAVGIMQILPETARSIVAPPGGGHVPLARLRSLLADPRSNLALGQQYLNYLARLDGIDGNLLHVLASYDCGPARFAQWAADLRDLDDPMLFVEAIPIDETRAYVPRVLTYTWLYARRLRQPTPTLDALAAGDWPHWHLPAPARPPVPSALSAAEAADNDNEPVAAATLH